MYVLQQPTKKIDESETTQILNVLPIETELVAKQNLQAHEDEQEFFPTQQSPQSGNGNPKKSKIKKKNKKKQTKGRPKRKKGSLSLLEKLFPKNPAPFGSPK